MKVYLIQISRGKWDDYATYIKCVVSSKKRALQIKKDIEYNQKNFIDNIPYNNEYIPYSGKLSDDQLNERFDYIEKGEEKELYENFNCANILEFELNGKN